MLGPNPSGFGGRRLTQDQFASQDPQTEQLQTSSHVRSIFFVTQSVSADEGRPPESFLASFLPNERTNERYRWEVI